MKTIIPLLIFLTSINVFAQNEPSWINNYPLDERYYIGIGSSGTGNKSDDYEQALIQARLNLAAEISTKIQGETEITVKDTNNGEQSASFTQQINQSVEQYLKELEIVDTFYSSRQGYWVYIRLNKNRWENIQQNEMIDLRSRINQVLGDEYFNGRLTTADKLFKIASASTLLNNSPYQNILSGEIGPYYSGNIYDFLISEIYSLSSGLSLSTNIDRGTIEAGNSIDLRIKISSSDYYAGKLPLSVFRGNEIIGESYSDINGNARINLDSERLHLGDNKISILIDPVKIGLPDSRSFKEEFLVAEKEISITVDYSSIYLTINANKQNLDYLYAPISSLFSTGNEKFKLSDDSSKATYNLQVSLNFTDFPQVLENAPLMAGIDCIISLKKGNRVLYEYKNMTLKDGGLSYDQAYRRVFNKLVESLNRDRSFIDSIEDELSE